MSSFLSFFYLTPLNHPLDDADSEFNFDSKYNCHSKKVT